MPVESVLHQAYNLVTVASLGELLSNRARAIKELPGEGLVVDYGDAGRRIARPESGAFD